MKQQYKGLTEEQVLHNRQQYGVNVLTPPEREPLWKKFLGKFSDPLIIILLVAGVLSIGISFRGDLYCHLAGYRTGIHL